MSVFKGAMCKKLSQLLPAGVAWGLLVGSTAFFYTLVAPRLIQDDMWGVKAYFIVGIDVFLFLLVVSNLVMAMCLDPGIYPIATVSEEQNGGDEFRSPLYKNVVINGISVRMKWCVTCKFYRPPRASHCSVCNRCIDNFDHHCPWVHNCVGWRNYRYFFFFLVALSLHMIYVFITCGTYVIETYTNRGKDDSIDPPFLCAFTLTVLTLVLCIPVIGLTIFHVILVVRGRSTNEQVTGKFQSGFNPFTRGWAQNCFFALCHSQTPSFVGYPSTRAKKRTQQRNKRTLKVLVTDETSVLYVPDGDGKEGHIRLKQMRQGDSDSVGTALSLGRRGEEKSLATANGSTCNLYEDRNSTAAAYEASVAEAMAGSSLSAGSPSSERLALLNGGRFGKPLAFSDAMRIHDELSSPTKGVNL